MRKYMWWMMPWALLAVLGVLWSRFHHAASEEPVLAVAPTARPETLPAARIEATTPAVAIPATAGQSSTVGTPLFVAGLEATLRADDDGALILDAETRTALEMLIGMSAGEREERKQRLVQQLPAVAASQALDLLQRMTDYRNAAAQLFSMETAPTTPEQADSALATAHQLRIDYLGEEAARKFFERDEKFARMLFGSAGGLPGSQPRTAEQEARMVSDLRSAFALLMVPRKPPRAIGQQDP